MKLGEGLLTIVDSTLMINKANECLLLATIDPFHQRKFDLCVLTATLFFIYQILWDSSEISPLGFSGLNKNGSSGLIDDG